MIEIFRDTMTRFFVRDLFIADHWSKWDVHFVDYYRIAEIGMQIAMCDKDVQV